MTGELLLYAGIAICIAAAVCAVIATAAVFFTRKRLKRQLDEEYGKRRH